MTSVFAWRGQPSVIRIKQTTRPTKKFAGLQDPTNHHAAISVTGAKQGHADSHRRDALKRGGI